MKKLLLFLVMIVTINVSAQSTTWFSKPLELEKVPASTSKSDSVLVRGTDKIVKYVPRSEFSSGGSQDLQQTLENGNIASDTPIIIQDTDEGHKVQIGGRYINLTYPASTLEDTRYGMRDILVRAEDGTSNGGLTFGVGKFFLPVKNKTTNYTIATLDDITGGSQNLQQTVENGNTVLGQKKKIIFKTSEDIDTNTTEIQAGHIYVGNGGLSQASIDYTHNGILGIVHGSISLSQTNSDGLTRINNFLIPNPNSTSFGEEVSSNTFYLPVNIEDETTARTLATTNDISLQKVVDNNNTAIKEFGVRFYRENVPESYTQYAAERTTYHDGDNFIDTNYNAFGIYSTKSDTSSSLALNIQTTPGINSSFNFPQIDGNFTLAITDDIKKIYTNASTTAPTTSAELDSLYPNAKEGDEVTFLEATPYSLITKKLLSGWVMYQVGKLP